MSFAERIEIELPLEIIVIGGYNPVGLNKLYGYIELL